MATMTCVCLADGDRCWRPSGEQKNRSAAGCSSSRVEIIQGIHVGRRSIACEVTPLVVVAGVQGMVLCRHSLRWATRTSLARAIR